VSSVFGRMAVAGNAWLAVLLVGHVAATAWIVNDYRRGDTFLAPLAVSALPSAQASLLAVWIVWGRLRSYVRVAVALVGLTVVWAVECHSLGLELTDERCAAHALAFAVQTVVISGALAVVPLITWLAGRRDSRRPRWPIQFGAGVLFGWTAAAAVVLGAWKLALGRSKWPLEVVTGELFLFGAAVGVYNALFALILLAGTGRRRPWKLAALGVVPALTVVLAVAGSQPVVLRALFGEIGNVDMNAWLVLAGLQVCYMAVTLVPIRPGVMWQDRV